MTPPALREWVGGTDIYLLDQIIKGRITPDMSVLDAGCGAGRNLKYLARVGAEVWGVDESAEATLAARRNVEAVTGGSAVERFTCAAIEDMEFEGRVFDVVICNAVLHFSRDEGHFNAMVDALWQVLKTGGLFFARLASSIGIEDRVQLTALSRAISEGTGGQSVGWFALPDGSERFLVDEPFLLETTARLGGELLEPLKTTNVQGLRCMTTWVLRKTPEVSHVRP
ncbi:MAG: class I SAM-dependent methyltransferase [Longimicrobiales bacterium]